jgi:hypothetical protein
MIIKNHPNRNDYCLAKCGYWVRDFTKSATKPCDINDMTPLEDVKLIIENEFKNNLRKYQIAESNVIHDKIVIIGDGYGFEKSVKLIEELPPDVTIMGVNGSFAKWKSERRLNYYVVNNPYQECLYYYPQIIRTWPKCIASTRTNPNFLEIYKGLLYIYSPVNCEVYSGIIKEEYNFLIDDYRNPICAAIGLSYKYGAKKILIMSTVEMYKDERPGTEIVKDGLWIYPQQKLAHDLVDADLYWMKKAKIDVGYTDTEPDYEFATYIKSDEVKRFLYG